MTLRTTLAVFITACALTCSAQTKTNKVTVTDGPENDAKRSYVIGMFGYDETGYYTLRYEKKKMLIEHLNASMVVDRSVEAPKPVMDKAKLGYTSAMQLGDQIFFFYSRFDSHAKTNTLYYQEIDKSTFLAKGDLKQVAQATFESRRSFMQTAAFSSPFSIVASEDHTHAMIVTRNQTEGDAGKTIEMKLTVFKEGMEVEWEQNLQTEYDAELFSVTNIRLDDNGDVSIMGIEYTEKLTEKQVRRSGKPNYKHHLLRYTEKGNKFLNLPVELSGKFITDLRIETAPSGDIIVAGFYSETGTTSIKGAFYMSIDHNTESVKVQNFSEFESEFITQNLTDREEKKAKKKEDKGEELEMNQYDMRRLIIKADGGATLIAEQFIFYTTTYTTYSNGKAQTYTSYNYLYNDIVVASFDNQGSLLWKNKIAKRQHTQNDGGMYSSYAMAVVGDKLFFIFNDNPKNLFLPEGEAPYNFSASKDLAVMLVEVDNSGKVAKELLFTTERGDALVRPSLAEQTGDKEMILFSQRTKIFQYSKLTFK